MQPYFFPYIGYFQLMAYVDRWVVFDETQFIHKGWVNRNRVLHPDIQKQWQYVTVPLAKKSRDEQICNLLIHPDDGWRNQILGKLTSYRKKAPYYAETMDFVADCFDCKEQSLVAFLVSLLRKTQEHIGFDTQIDVQSDLDLAVLHVEHAGQWSLRIAEQLGASSYINPAGGAGLFREGEFNDAGIELRFLESQSSPYDQGGRDFVAGLSIIDVLMWNGKEAVKSMLSSNFALKTADAIAS